MPVGLIILKTLNGVVSDIIYAFWSANLDVFGLFKIKKGWTYIRERPAQRTVPTLLR